MRIGIDAYTLGIVGGPRTYLLNLIGELLLVDRENEYIIFYPCRKFIGKFPTAKEVYIPPSHFLFRLLREHILLPIYCILYRIDLLHSPKSACPVFSPCKRVVTIHDIIPIKYPETEKPLARLYWRIQIPLAAKFSEKIVTVSKHSKEEIIKKFRIPEEKIKVIYHGVNKTHPPSTLHPPPYILYVGTIKPRKNLEVLIRAYASIKGNIKQKLVICGRLGYKYKSIFAEAELSGLVVQRPDEHISDPDVIFTGPVPDEEISSIYRSASLFIYLPSYEGFGLPVLEAMAFGVPVICSDIPSLREIADSAVVFVNLAEIKKVEEAIISVIGNEKMREKMIKRGMEVAKKFSWERTALETLRVYKTSE